MKLSATSVFGFLLLFLCFLSCHFKFQTSPLCYSWKEVSEDEITSELEEVSPKHEFNQAYLRMYDNQEYTYLNTRRFVKGKWAFNVADSILTIYNFKDSTDLHLHLSALDDKWMKGKTDQTLPLLFKKYPGFEYKDIDLLTAASNQWQIKPNHKESVEEIRTRVTGHVDYLVKYFEIIEGDERPVFEPGYLHTPVNFYQNGIGVKTESTLPRSWINCFYDLEDAQAGAHLIGQSIQSITEYPRNTKSYTEGYLKALKEMKEFLVKVK
jgi:hypothetical protein